MSPGSRGEYTERAVETDDALHHEILGPELDAPRSDAEMAMLRRMAREQGLGGFLPDEGEEE